MPHDVIMPALGMAQDTGRIVAWLKRPGDAVAAGEPLFEVETDKATMEVEAQAVGFLGQVSAGDGDEVPVGSVVAVIAETAEGAAPQPAGGKRVDAGAQTDTSAEALPEGKTVIMPALGMAQDTGKLVAWRKRPGDTVSASNVLFEVETDKSVMEVEAGHDGYVAACLALEGEDVTVGTPAAVISETRPDNPIMRSAASESTPRDGKAGTERSSRPQAPVAIAREQPDTTQDARPQGSPVVAPRTGGRILASPKARRLAAEQGLDLQRLADRGVAQPFHVADLEILRGLPHEIAVPIRPATAVMNLHVAARIPAGGSDGFVRWMKQEGGIEIASQLLWLRFATAALRMSTERAAQRVVTEIRSSRQTIGRYADADLSRLTAPQSDDSDTVPDLVLRDITDTAVTAATSRAASSPVLTIGRDGDAYAVTFDYSEEHLPEAQAFDFVQCFAERLTDPLAHIV